MCGLYLYVLDVCLTRASDASLGGCSSLNRKQRIRGNRTGNRESGETEQKSEFQRKQNRKQSVRGNRTEIRVSGETKQKTEFQGKQNRKQSFQTEIRVSGEFGETT